MSLNPNRAEAPAVLFNGRKNDQLTRVSGSLAKNHEKGVDGGISPDTYVAFLIIEALAYATQSLEHYHS